MACSLTSHRVFFFFVIYIVRKYFSITNIVTYAPFAKQRPLEGNRCSNKALKMLLSCRRLTNITVHMRKAFVPAVLLILRFLESSARDYSVALVTTATRRMLEPQKSSSKMVCLLHHASDVITAADEQMFGRHYEYLQNLLTITPGGRGIVGKTWHICKYVSDLDYVALDTTCVHSCVPVLFN
jgi:hypothetical protein